jgi:hypothetical protein
MMSDINEKLNHYLQEEKEKKEKDKKNNNKFVDDGEGLIVTKFKKAQESNK